MGKTTKVISPPYCEIPGCGYDRHVQRHRIIPGRDGGKYKLGNVIALCPTHHAEADAGEFHPEYLLCLVAKRIDREARASKTVDDGDVSTGETNETIPDTGESS